MRLGAPENLFDTVFDYTILTLMWVMIVFIVIVVLLSLPALVK